MHKKLSKNKWIEYISIYHHAKFEVEQNIVQEEINRETCIQSQTLYNGRCLCALCIHIFG